MVNPYDSDKTLEKLINSIDTSEPKEMRKVKESDFEAIPNYMNSLLNKYGRNR